jgi:hypothetical protein
MVTEKIKDWISWEEAITLVMQRTGRSRRQAKVALAQKCRSGELPASVCKPGTDEHVRIPPEAFPPTH